MPKSERAISNDQVPLPHFTTIAIVYGYYSCHNTKNILIYILRGVYDQWSSVINHLQEL